MGRFILALALVVSQRAWAQDYPARDIRDQLFADV